MLKKLEIEDFCIQTTPVCSFRRYFGKDKRTRATEELQIIIEGVHGIRPLSDL